MFALLVFTAIGVFLTLKGTLGGIILVGIAFVMFGLWLRNISANPPHKGLVIIWGKRYPSIIGEGYVFEHLRCNAVAGCDFQSGAAVTPEPDGF